MTIPPDVVRPPGDTRLPPHLIVEFWSQIYLELQTRYGLPAADAAAVIIDFRADEHRVGDMQYHANWYDVAQTIATGWRKRLAQPAMSAVAAAPSSTQTPVTP